MIYARKKVNKKIPEVIVWVSAKDCDPPHGLDMTNPHDYNKVEWLENMFNKSGFDKTKSALIGYSLNNKIQLLSGTHRHEAAIRTNTLLPIMIWLRSSVEESWGFLDKWLILIKDIPVLELENWTREDIEKHRLQNQIKEG